MAVCADPGCEAEIKDHAWGRIKADGWFQQRNGDVWCPDHIPDWVEAWRRRRDARMIEERRRQENDR